MTSRAAARVTAAPFALAFALPFALLAGCAGDRAPVVVERADSAGITIITNRGPDRPLPWAFEHAFTLGGADEGPQAFFNVGRGSLAIDATGHLYVLDRGNHRIVVFDGTGGHVRAMSRRGGGPGELQWPAAIVVTGNGELAIADIGHRGLVRLTTTGEPIENQMLERWFGGGIAPFGHGLAIQLDGRSNEESRHELTRIDESGQHLLVASERATLRPVDLGCVQIGGMAPLFAPSLVWAAGADRVAAVTGAGYDVQLYDLDGPIARVRRDEPPRQATRDLAIQEVGEKFEVTFGGGGSCVAEPATVVDARGFADHIPAIRRVAIDPDGMLWVRRFAVRGDPAPIDVFSADGEYVGTLPPDTPFPEAFFPDGRVAVIEKDDLDLDLVVVYRLRKGSEHEPARLSGA